MIDIKNLNFRYAHDLSPVLQRVNATLKPATLTLICGATGSGKTTLLKTLNGLAPNFSGGEISGSIAIDELEIIGQKPHKLANLVGYVGQNPEHTFVAESVEAELAFGMQQLGFEPNEMRRRIDDICAALDLESLLERHPSELSGGEQQRVAIAAALVAGQKVLLLDEPTSALDLDIAEKVLELLSRLTRERSLTVVVAEHRIERLAKYVDQAIILFDDGTSKIQSCHDALQTLKSMAQARVHHWPSLAGSTPSTPVNASGSSQFENLHLSYGKHVALHQTDIQLAPASITALIGPNGSGKTSLLWAIWAQAQQSGSAVALVPQTAADLLFLGSLADELQESDRQSKSAAQTTASIFMRIAGRIDPATHPRDLSSGQQLALVLAIQLAKGAEILLLDEPTRGLDYSAKKELGEQLSELARLGHSVLVASHDLDFLKSLTHKALLMQEGRLVGEHAL